MADFQPFAALRYDTTVAGHPDDLVAPPYDIVSPAEKRALYERSPFNISRVDFGEERPGDTDADNRYTRARDEIARWVGQGVLKRDAEPRLYVYDQHFQVEGRTIRRRAVFGRLRLESWDSGVILPHEHTRPRDKADRYELLRTTRVNLSPIMPMYRSAAATSALTDDAVEAPVFEATLNGEKHTLSLLSPAAAEAFRQAIAPERLYIADGHHRYETALAYRDLCMANATSWSGDEQENFVLAALVDANDPGLVVLPIHRLLKVPGEPLDLDQLTGLFFRTPIPVSGPQALPALKDLLATGGARTSAYGSIGQDGRRLDLLTVNDAGAIETMMPAECPPEWRALDVAVLHNVVMPAIGFEETPDTIAFTEDAQEALDEVASGEYQHAFLLNPTRVDQVIAVAEAGERMPQKSTFFYPKLGSGIVMMPLD